MKQNVGIQFKNSGPKSELELKKSAFYSPVKPLPFLQGKYFQFPLLYWSFTTYVFLTWSLSIWINMRFKHAPSNIFYQPLCTNALAYAKTRKFRQQTLGFFLHTLVSCIRFCYSNTIGISVHPLRWSTEYMERNQVL